MCVTPPVLLRLSGDRGGAIYGASYSVIQRDSARNSGKRESARFGSITEETLGSVNGNGLSG